MRTEPAPGTDPEPGTRDALAIGATDDTGRAGARGNDDQLRQDVPPHW